MQPITVALIQLAWNGSIEGMKTQYRRLIPQAVDQGASLICLPEFSLLPYFPGTTDPSGFDWAEPLEDGISGQFLGEMAKQYNVSIVGSIYEKAGDDLYYDTAVIYGTGGQLLGYTRKVHIPSGVGYHETHFFSGYNAFPVHDLGACKLAAPTCYDQWFPELARIYTLNGAEFIFYPTAIGSEPTDPNMDSSEQWQTVMRGHAIANGIFIGAANRVGAEDQVKFYGSSFICDPMGRILAQAGRESTEVITASLDPYTLTHWRKLFPLLYQRKPHTYGRLLESDVPDAPPSWLGK